MLPTAFFNADSKIQFKRFGMRRCNDPDCHPAAHGPRPALAGIILEVSAELERMGDYGQGIATINIRMAATRLLSH